MKKRPIHLLGMKFMVSFGINQIGFKIRKNFLLVANVIHLAGNLILRAKKISSHFCKNGLIGSDIQLTLKIKYRYCLGGSQCERPITE